MLKEDLEMIIKFLYSGKIYCDDQIVVTKVCKNLTQLFGFPSIMKLSTDGNFLKKTQKQKLTLTTDAFNLDDLLTSKKSNTDDPKVCMVQLENISYYNLNFYRDSTVSAVFFLGNRTNRGLI